MTKTLVLLALLALPFTAGAADLFDAEETLAITIRGEMKTLSRERDKSKRYPAEVEIDGVKIPVQLQVRGNNRLKKSTCENPPLRLYFDKEARKETIFDKEAELKLVVQCDDSGRFANFLRLEYLTYKLYEKLSPNAFRVRWLDVTWENERTKQQPAFFIERKKRMGKRLGIEQVRQNSTTRKALDEEAAARVDLFQFMVGNLDYSIMRAPGEEDCCHNTKLMAASDGSGKHIPVPYDFDSSGLVDAPYAVPPDNISVAGVGVRRYRGLCNYNDEVQAVRAHLQENWAEFSGIISNDPILAANSKKRAVRYLEKFYKVMEKDSRFDRDVIRRCR